MKEKLKNVALSAAALLALAVLAVKVPHQPVFNSTPDTTVAGAPWCDPTCKAKLGIKN